MLARTFICRTGQKLKALFSFLKTRVFYGHYFLQYVLHLRSLSNTHFHNSILITNKCLIMVENRNQEEQREMGQKSRRGFAAMDPERQKQIASEGGRAAHRQGVAHEWSADEARQAGRKGGQNSKGSRGRTNTGREEE